MQVETGLNSLEGIRHHSDEHIDENYDGHCMVDHKEDLSHPHGDLCRLEVHHVALGVLGLHPVLIYLGHAE